MATDQRGEARSNGARSPLPFVLLLVLCLYIGVEKTGLLSAGRQTAGEAASSSSQQTLRPLQVTSSVGSSATTEAVTSDDVVARRRTSESSGHGDVPPHLAMLFLFNAIIIGTFIAQLLSSVPALHGLQQTVVIFGCGITYSLFLEGLGLNDGLGVLGQSYEMWMAIDPHLLLFALLPPLLAGDAMTMDTAVARKVSKQWLYLAGPGVLINAFLTALFLYVYLPYKWPFLLCLVTGAILCATDPVAVVALLKELGAPPALTVQIQGESLLNDGTAIVLYQLAYKMLQGEEYDASAIIIFMMKTAACAWGLGLLIGWFFYLWITAASNKLDAHASVIQICLSLCCAYWSFIMAEGVFGISGVLACVAASLVLADKMWPVLVCKESMHTVWEMLEFLGNIVVFFLAGSLTGNMMVHMPIADYFHVLTIYVVLVVIRGAMLLASRPMLNFFGARSVPPSKVSLADCLVMTWGGLRGAVGLALAIQMAQDRADGEISVIDANRVLFYVGGVATLTLAINASSAPAMVKALGITALPETKKRVLLMVQEQLFWLLDRKTQDDALTPAVKGLREALDHISKWIEDQGAGKKQFDAFFSKSSPAAETEQTAGIVPSPRSAKSGSSLLIVRPDEENRKSRSMADIKGVLDEKAKEASASTVGNRQSVGGSARRTMSKIVQSLGHDGLKDLHSYEEITRVLEDVKGKFSQVKPENLALLGELPVMPTHEQEVEVMKCLANESKEDSSLVQAFKEVFLNLVNVRYWHLIDEGEVVPGTSEAEILLSSIKLARGQCGTDSGLTDFNHIVAAIDSQVRKGDKQHDTPKRMQDDSADADMPLAAPGKPSCISRFIESAGFNAVIMSFIIANGVVIVVEDSLVDESKDKADLGWLLADGAFTAVFALEFMLKLSSLRCQYFKDSWNNLDFVLVILSIFGIIVGGVAQGSVEGADVSSESRLVRLSRVFRVMRLMRLFRLLQFLRVLKAKLIGLEFSNQVAKHMQTITVLTCFIKAHMHSQGEILLYFGTAKKVDLGELARCIIESQVQTYKAMSLAVDSVEQLAKDKIMLREVNSQKCSNHLAETLDILVHNCHKHSVITSREAEEVLEPVQTHLKRMQSAIRELHFGYIRPASSSALSDYEGSHDREAEVKSGISEPATGQPSASSSEVIAAGDTTHGSIKDASVQSSLSPWGEPPVRLGEDEVVVIGGSSASSSSDAFVAPVVLPSREPAAIGKLEDVQYTPLVPELGAGLQAAEMR